MHYNTILRFWFHELKPADWWIKNDELDHLIEERFIQIHAVAASGELESWRTTAHGCLAEIIILDQFSRNIYRSSAKAYQYDSMSLVLSQNAISKGFDRQLSLAERSFIYMPFMHSESKRIHEKAVLLFAQPGLEDSLAFEYKHKEIIDRFNRYPHRNQHLRRQSTQEELIFLSQPGSSF